MSNIKFSELSSRAIFLKAADVVLNTHKNPAFGSQFKDLIGLI